jgi:DNA-binding NtrC family response regulator
MPIDDFHILIIDDDPAINTMIALVLQDQGYHVENAYSTEQAQQYLTAHRCAIVILDLGLPPDEHTPDQGFGLLNWIQAHQTGCHIIVLTGQLDTAYESIKLGAFDYLNKPVEASAIVNSVKRARLFYQQQQKMKNAGIHAVRLQSELGSGIKNIRNQAEESIIRLVLQDCDYNIHEAARRLGLKRENVYYLMKKYNLERQVMTTDDL